MLGRPCLNARPSSRVATTTPIGGCWVVHKPASASQASTVTGAAVNLSGYDTPIVIVQSHGTGTGTLDGKIQDSADGSTGWADVTGATFSQSTTTADVKILSLDPKSTKGYIRYVGTIAGTTPSFTMGVVLLGQKSASKAQG